jgi:hypothetical protein
MTDNRIFVRKALATSPIITAGFGSLQASCLALHNYALTRLSSGALDFTRDIQHLQKLQVTIFQQKLIGESNGNERVYSVFLAGTSSLLQTWLVHEVPQLWWQFLHERCSFLEPNQTCVTPARACLNP